MSKIFKNQSYLRITLETGVNVSGAIEKKIYYEKPSGIVGSIDATVGDVVTGVLYYDMPVISFLDEWGLWKFWAYIKFSDNRIARGETISERIFNDEQG